MDVLSEALARLVRRQQEVDERLARIEDALGITRPAPSPPPPTPVAVPEREREMAPPAAPPPPPLPSRPLETRMGLTWINRIGVVTLVLGVAFFFKYAVDNQWIGETGRVALGILAGLLLLGIGDAFRRRAQETFGQGICGAGIAVLYVSIYAAFGFYKLIPFAPAFGLMALNTAAAGALALRYRSAAIAALGLIGGYLTPVVLSTGQDRPWALFGYVLLLDLGAFALVRSRNWTRIAWLALLGTSLLYWAWLAEFNRSDKTAAYVFSLVFYALFSALGKRGLFIAAQFNVVAALLAVSLPDPLPFLPLAVAVSAAALILAGRLHWGGAPLAAFVAFWVAYTAGHATFKQHSAVEPLFVLLTLAFLLFFACTPWTVLVRKTRARREDMVIIVLNAGFYFAASYDLLAPHYRSWLGLFAVALAALHFALGREIRAVLPEEARDARTVLLYIGVALAFLTLAAPIQFTGYRITMAWALEAAGLSWIGVRTGERRLAYGSLFVFFLVFVRLFASDAWIYSGAQPYAALWNVRFITFITAAVAFLLAAWWIRTGAAALAPYLAGHFVMLWALGAEVFGFVNRTAAPSDLQNARSTAISILMALYAVLLVALGVARRSALNRLLGLWLIGVVALKLYLYDVWRISRGMYRVAAFAALGILLLVTSYLYSRYRGSIESWWRDESNR